MVVGGSAMQERLPRDAPNNSEFEFRTDDGSQSLELYGRMVPRGKPEIVFHAVSQGAKIEFFYY